MISAQKPDDVLATATEHSIRLRDLSAEIQKNVADFPANLSKMRAGLLDQMIHEQMLKLEAASRAVSTGKLIAGEKAKVLAPTEAEIKAFFIAKQNQLGGKTLDEVRKPIADYLRGQAEQKMLGEMFTRLKTKYKFTAGKDVNAVGLAPNDPVANLNGRPITAKEFEDFARIPLNDDKADLADAVLDGIHEALYNRLLADEAKAIGIDSGMLIGREITDKMKDFSDAERQTLVDDLAKRLFAKYQAKIIYTAPVSLVQNISASNSPAIGPANAPVTIVMFSDFQCSACSATHPILKKAIESYPGKNRFVVRSFPLESVHANAWRAALAAAAANAQGKFFEYIEILYNHQDALDDASLKKYAAELGLNVKQFELDFNSEKTAALVRKDMADGESYGIGRTPTIFVNGRSVRNLSAEGFKSAIDKALGNK
ncbi:MAG: DsbA family protein [Pyrinomonadaceae bacterium]